MSRGSKFREAAKAVIRSLAVCVVAPLALTERMARNIFGRDVWFVSHGELLSLLPFRFGRYLRNAYYWMTLSSCPLDCCFLFGMSFRHSRAVVGHRVYIGTYSLVGLATIGDDTLIGDNVHLLSGKRQHSFAELHRPIQEQEQVFTRIFVGRNCWVGTNSVVMEDIGDDCIVGAASVVTRRISQGTVSAGNPCRILRHLREATGDIEQSIDLPTAERDWIETPVER